MNKKELYREVSHQSNLPLWKVRQVMESFMDVVVSTTSRGEEIRLTGFGVFGVKHRNERLGRNPHTGEAVPIPARNIPSFIPGVRLYDAINNKEGE